MWKRCDYYTMLHNIAYTLFSLIIYFECHFCASISSCFISKFTVLNRILRAGHRTRWNVACTEVMRLLRELYRGSVASLDSVNLWPSWRTGKQNKRKRERECCARWRNTKINGRSALETCYLCASNKLRYSHTQSPTRWGPLRRGKLIRELSDARVSSRRETSF